MRIFKAASEYAKEFSVSADALADFLKKEAERLGFVCNGDTYRDCLRVRIAIERFAREVNL